MSQNTTTNTQRPTVTEHDTDRLALLWRAFEEAEQRIADLERDLDRARTAKLRDGAPAHVPAMDARPAARSRELIEAEARLKESVEREARLVAELAAARRAAEAENMRYTFARSIIQHENANARKLEDEKDKLVAALHESRRHASEIEAARVDLAAGKARAEVERDALRNMVECERTEASMIQARLEVAQYVMEKERERADTAEADLALEAERAEIAEYQVIIALDRATSSDILSERERERAATLQFLAQEAETRAEIIAEQVRALAARPPVTIHVPVPVEVPMPVRVPVHVPVHVPVPVASRVYAVSRLFPIDASRIAEIPGIRADEVAALRRVGFNMADALLYANLAPLAEAADIGLPRLAKLRALAELMALNGIGPEWAERLYRAGVRSIDDLAAMSATDLEATLVRSYDGQGLGHEARALFERTLPARCGSVVAAAKKAVGST